METGPEVMLLKEWCSGSLLAPKRIIKGTGGKGKFYFVG
jgi:hypothetical protein